MLKDLKLAMEAVEDVGANTPLGKLSADIYGEMDAAGHGSVDFSGVIRKLAGSL